MMSLDLHFRPQTATVCFLILMSLTSQCVAETLRFTPEERKGENANGESWAYVTVRPKAHMFYWVYQTTHPSGVSERPLILWLQGGPGASGTGFGNFEELGPLDINLMPRNTTWLQTASLLFIDNPVGTGYSFAEDDSAFTRDLEGICTDLLVVMKSFIKSNPVFEKVPFYIFSESYGGKMTAGFSAVLSKAISEGGIKLNFKGFGMGDSWINPVSYTNTWGPYLYSTSIISKSDLALLTTGAGKVSDLINQGKWAEATEEWGNLEDAVEEVGAGVNFYNILDWTPEEVTHKNSRSQTYLGRLYNRHVGYTQAPSLDDLMNGPIRKKLGIIPKDVTWGGQSEKVFEYQAGDFMKSVATTVNDLINAGNLTVVVFNGQLDLICNTIGTSDWFYKYTDIAAKFEKAKRYHHTCNTPDSTCFFSKKVDNFRFYWILKAGHMVPADNGQAALAMVNDIIGV